MGCLFAGMFFGFMLVLVSVFLLFWNEGRAVKNAKMYRESTETVIPVSARLIDPSNEGKLVHLTGLARPVDTLKDTAFGFSVNAVKLRRIVEMYQWKEESDSGNSEKAAEDSGKVENYTYYKTWSQYPIHSSLFKNPEGHQNPEMPYPPKFYNADEVKVGKFFLARGLFLKMTGYEDLPVEKIEKKRGPGNPGKKLNIYEGKIYIQSDPHNPVIGDVRIFYKTVMPPVVSVIAKQSGSSLQPYTTEERQELALLRVGSHTAEEMFEQNQHQLNFFAWVFRVIGFVLSSTGVLLIVTLLASPEENVTVLGKLVDFGTGTVSFALSTFITLGTIAIAWINYRPLYGILLLAVASLPILWFVVFIIRMR